MVYNFGLPFINWLEYRFCCCWNSIDVPIVGVTVTQVVVPLEVWFSWGVLSKKSIKN